MLDSFPAGEYQKYVLGLGHIERRRSSAPVMDITGENLLKSFRSATERIDGGVNIRGHMYYGQIPPEIGVASDGHQYLPLANPGCGVNPRSRRWTKYVPIVEVPRHRWRRELLRDFRWPVPDVGFRQR